MNPFYQSLKSNKNSVRLVASTPSEVVVILEECHQSLSVAEWACDAFSTFTASALQTGSAEAFAKLLDEGICESLVSTMNMHCAASLEVTVKGCRALSDLTQTYRELREFLGELGACECVVFALSMHVGDPDVSEYGTATLINLSKDNISNSFRQASAGACEVLVQIGNFGFNLRHPKCAIVAANVSNAICNLCEAVNQAKLAESGACELVTSLVKFHLESVEVVSAATRAICGLASLSSINRDILGRAGACRLIVNAINTHKDHIGIIESCCEAIMHLALHTENTRHFYVCGGCESIVRALDVHLMEREFGPEICVGGMVNLITYGTSAKENAILLQKLDVVTLLKRVHLSTRASQRARDNASQIIRDLVTLGLIAITNEETATDNMKVNKTSLKSNGIGNRTISSTLEFELQTPTPINDTKSLFNGNIAAKMGDDHLLLARTSTENELATGVFEI